MFHSNTFVSNSKSLREKKLAAKKISTKTSEFFKETNKPVQKFINEKFLYQLTFKNLIKYSTNKKIYNKFIINSIIFDQRIHKVAVFKNNLLWDESSEFLKRFYRKKESCERIPKISEYYEKYTLFPPVYFGLEGLIIIIMNKWTKKKKNYLEYIEDHEEEKKKSKIKESFEPLINYSSLDNINSKSLVSKNTLELTKFENDSKKSLFDENKFSSSKKNKQKNNNDISNDKIENLSFSEVINDLSSSYSVIINPDNNNQNKNKNINHLKDGRIINKISNNKDKTRNQNYSNNKTLNITNDNNKVSNNNVKKLNIRNEEYLPKKSVKINYNKKCNKYILNNNNPKILFRNIPTIKIIKNRILKTENIIKRDFHTKYNSKGTIRVNTLTNYTQEKNNILNSNSNVQSVEKDHNSSLKKYSINFIGNNESKNLISKYKNKYINTINDRNTRNSSEKLQSRIIKNKNNILKKKHYIQIKKESFLNINNLNNSINKLKLISNRNQTLIQNKNYFKEIMNIQHNSKRNLVSNIPKINMDIINSKKIKDISNNSKKLNLEDPFLYKLTQLNKKKITPLTSANSLTKIKNLSKNGINSLLGNRSNINNSNNKLKIVNKKNLVLTKLNSKNSLVYNKKRNILGNNSLMNHSTNSSLIPRNNNNSGLNFSISNKKTNSWKKLNKKINSKNINLNLNLNIHFDIGLENKNKGRKLIFNNTIINQLQNKKNKNLKIQKINKSKEKEFIYQYPLTSRENNSHIKDLMDINKMEYTFFKKC